VAFLATAADARLRAETEDALARILSEGDFRQYGAAIEVLKELAPEKAVGALSSWLGTGDRQMRVVAAASLGQIDSEQSVDALTAALGGRDALTRQAAASSLAQIRSDGARAALLDAYRSAGPDIQESIAIAIASHGDQSVQRALASVAAPLGSSARSLPVAGASWPGSNQQITQ
jgi:HEAT repeat protein